MPGDVNGDGYRDAVLPAPGANVAGKMRAGAVVVIYGSKSGLSTFKRAVITQNTAGVPGSAEAHDGFGGATGAIQCLCDLLFPTERGTRSGCLGTIG
ncbi:integrin alpha [Streptomyces massasporeus]|uniref:integrin alpha n=1 Tax=Streptomyces massasporeus TaxID=67324 RepID=UPI003F54166A